MADLVDPTRIEEIVGATRHPTDHIARAVSAEQTVYVLHSQACKASGIDLRDCPFSLALDRGIDSPPPLWDRWEPLQDRPVVVAVLAGRLVPDPRIPVGGESGE